MTTHPLGITSTEVAEGTEWDVACERTNRRSAGSVRILPCQGSGRAEWALWFACGCSPGYVLYCTVCKDAVLTFPGGLCCRECDQTFHPASTAYALVEPLNRRPSS